MTYMSVLLSQTPHDLIMDTQKRGMNSKGQLNGDLIGACQHQCHFHLAAAISNSNGHLSLATARNFSTRYICYWFQFDPIIFYI